MLKKCCPAWTRTTVNGAKTRCPTTRRPGNNYCQANYINIAAFLCIKRLKSCNIIRKDLISYRPGLATGSDSRRNLLALTHAAAAAFSAFFPGSAGFLAVISEVTGIILDSLGHSALASCLCISVPTSSLTGIIHIHIICHFFHLLSYFDIVRSGSNFEAKQA